MLQIAIEKEGLCDVCSRKLKDEVLVLSESQRDSSVELLVVHRKCWEKLVESVQRAFDEPR